MVEPRDDLDLVRDMLAKGEFDEIREMARIWRGMKALGAFGTFILKVFGLVGGLYASYYAFVHWVLEAMKGNPS